MSETVFTDGEWVYSETQRPRNSYEATYVVTIDGDRDKVLLTDERYYPVAPENKADAQLMALSKEMAEAIIVALDEIGGRNALNEEQTSGVAKVLQQLADRINQIGTQS